MAETVKKADLVESLANEQLLSKRQAGEIVDLVMGEITTALKQGKRVALTPFGSFKIRNRAAPSGRVTERAPRLGEQLPVVRAVADAAEKSERLSGVALSTFFKIAELWKLSAAEQRVLLGSIPESTYYKYAKSPDTARLSRDTLERISHLVGIFKAINILLPRNESADAWVRRKNDASLFKGRSALDFMLSGSYEHIAAVRHYLDGERSW